ncbi:uncharacterized protein LOC126673938 isoform X2 [Mercurialis annua]|uniref:uncharacterized protein LOC126673938 isoform X2 n=1 Tax=Mercurialis annua TaxID=3986 RepID=UPI00215E3C08|nr:uncharacterized protein LOC126673938 isoform X2 [Mercurialis annua]
MPVPKLKASHHADVMKLEEGNDALDSVIRQAIGKDSSLSFSRAGNNPVQWFQLLQALDQQQGWPLLTPLKVQMQKCDKCSREFCSPINYRRHMRVHHRLKKLDKDTTKNRELLGIFWDKLSDDEAKEILSFQDVALQEVPGSSILASLSNLIRKPVLSSLPQYYLRAGFSLLDMIQAKPSSFPLSSVKLFSILDDASERMFLCGAIESMQKYIFDGEAGKVGLEAKNVVAFTSYLVEQKLVKVWLADKDAEALRCQKLLVEEEEAAQIRHAQILERKRQKKLRLKEQKTKELRQGQADLMERVDDTFEAVASADEPCQLATSESDTNMHSVTLPDRHPSSLEPFQFPCTIEDVDLELQAGPDTGNSDPGTSHIVEHRIQRNSYRHRASRFHLSPKSHRNHVPNGFHASRSKQAPKFGMVQKHGSHRDLKSLPAINGNRKWSRKPKSGNAVKSRVHKEVVSQPDPDKKHEVLIGSISVTLGNCNEQEGNNFDGARGDCLPEHQMPKKSNVQDKHNRPDSSHSNTNRSTVKLWRPVSRNGSKGLTQVENIDRESRSDRPVVNDGNQSSENCQSLFSVDDNYDRAENNSSSLPQESPHPGGLLFSCQAAKAFLMERWKEAIADKHVTLVLSPDSEYVEIQSDCLVDIDQSSDIKNRSLLGNNTENQSVDAGTLESSASNGGKGKFRTKPEKGVKLKYIPKQRGLP